MNKFFRKLHLWVSIPFGVVITITCFTGAILVFESDIIEWCNRDMTTVEPKEKALPVKQLIGRVEPLLDDGVTITGVTIPDDPSQAYKVNLSKPHRAGVYIDQYTGNIKGKYERPAFFETMRRLHRWLMVPGPKNEGTHWGKIIVGTSTLAFLTILITGIVIWWPRNRTILNNRLKIAVKKGKKRLLHDLHVTGGFYAMMLLLAMAATGLTWSFEWYSNCFYSMLGVETTKEDGKVQRQPSQTDATTQATMQVDTTTQATQHAAEECCGTDYWQKAFETVKSQSRNYKTITISEGAITVEKDGLGNQRASDRYTFDNKNGEITSFKPYSSSSEQNKASGWVRTLHVGTWGGWVTKILYFLVALFGSTLPVTGYYLWFRRLYGKKGKL